MTCHIEVTTIHQVFGIIQWAAFTFGVCYLPSLYLAWRAKWWGFLHTETVAPPEKLVFSALAVLAAANTFAAWRMWYCDDWNADWPPLMIYFFMVIVAALYFPFINLLRDPIPAIISSVIATGLAIVFTVYAFISRDTWAGIVGIANIGVYAAELILAAEIKTKPKIYESYENGINRMEAEATTKMPHIDDAPLVATPIGAARTRHGSRPTVQARSPATGKFVGAEYDMDA